MIEDHSHKHPLGYHGRGLYSSGEDFVLEYGDLRFTFSEGDFSQRCEQAASRVGFINTRLSDEELEDLVTLAVNGEVRLPASRLGEHINEHWDELQGEDDSALVHWLRRLVFRGAWLDLRVQEGELDVRFCEKTFDFTYIHPGDRRPVKLAQEPSWQHAIYR